MTAAPDTQRTLPDGRLLVLAQRPVVYAGVCSCQQCFFIKNGWECVDPARSRTCGATGVWTTPSDAHQEA
jgi:hypothetical protein